jgi:DNA-binding response OmpR family regulator
MEKSKPNILIIEDDEYSREALEHLLKAEGYETQSAPDAVSGYRAARRSSPDVIVVDLRLPDIDGEQLIKKFRSHRSLRQVPIVVITGYSCQNLTSSEELRADVCLTKPAAFEDVIQAISNLARAGRAERDAL